MAQHQNKTQPRDTNRGQAQTHRVRYPDGSEGQMTQEEWRDRDKAQGIVRIDEDGNAMLDTDQPVQGVDDTDDGA